MSPTRILLAQHDLLIREDLKDDLQHAGYLVVGAVGDGATALRLARELRPDLVICCVIMPEMDGLTLAETLTREQIAPVLLCTGLCDDETVARAGAAGVVGYVTKHWRTADLRPAIELALARYHATWRLKPRRWRSGLPRVRWSRRPWRGSSRAITWTMARRIGASRGMP